MLCPPEFQEFFRLGRVLRVTLPTGKGRVVHLFVVFGYQGAEEDPDNLKLTDKLYHTLSLLRYRCFASVNLCSMLVILMLILL